jgi:hypothetical protein
VRPAKTEQTTSPPPAAPAPDEPQARGPQPPAPELPPEPPPELSEPYEPVVEPVVEPVIEPPGAGGDKVIARIKSLLEARKKMRVLTALDSAESVALVGGELRINFGPKAKVFAEQLGSRDTRKLLEEVAGEAVGRKLSIVVSGGGTPAPTTQPGDAGTPREAPANKRSPRERANSDPIVQAFVKTFRGQIVDVKPPEQ